VQAEIVLRRVGTVLWILVIIVGVVWVYVKTRPAPVVVQFDPRTGLVTQSDGREFAGVTWKRLPQMKRFELTERSGSELESTTLNGKPYVISFFFGNCPTICRDLNRQIQRLNHEFAGTDLTFLSLSVDPDNDTPERLTQYAGEFDADSQQWLFLTGQLYKIREVGEKQFRVIVDGVNHTGDLFLIDRWGRYRDRFTWDDSREMKRFSQVAREVLDETEPPLDVVVSTRNIFASLPHDKPELVPWLHDFQLTDQDDQMFWSRDLTGRVWVASMFFSRCPGVCPRQNKFLADLQAEISGRNAELVSITTDPQNDDPATLRQYGKSIGAGPAWRFLTGDLTYIRRIGSEFLGIAGEGEHHSTILVVVDRWGSVRGRIDWRNEGASKVLLDLIDQLNKEQSPVLDFEVVTNSESLIP
jgi:cytochrome oxidase Cu insertion factor (SCO1/SenC/PrrC family)